MPSTCLCCSGVLCRGLVLALQFCLFVCLLVSVFVFLPTAVRAVCVFVLVHVGLVLMSYSSHVLSDSTANRFHVV